MTIRLLARADDAGSFETANRAIRETVEDGIVRNVSVMAPPSALEHAADELAGLDGICTGVHVTLTSEWDAPRWGPVCPAEEVPSLVDEDGTFPRTGQELYDRDPDPDEVEAEVLAQIEAVREAGFDPDYLDEHMGVSWVRDFDELFAEIREREGLRWGNDAERLPDVETDATGPDRLLAQLEAADPGTYLTIGHPCFPDDEIRGIAKGGEDADLPASRDRQRRTFVADRVLDYCEDQGVEPIRFTDV